MQTDIPSETKDFFKKGKKYRNICEKTCIFTCFFSKILYNYSRSQFLFYKLMGDSSKYGKVTWGNRNNSDRR